MAWTPLYSDILDSSIWNESKETRLVWITILAKKDRDGFVRGNVGSLARDAVVSEEECGAALRVLAGPDPRSATKALDGRRIQEVDGGWLVVNHFKYRDLMKKSRKDYLRDYMREYRRRIKEKTDAVKAVAAEAAVKDALDGANAKQAGESMAGFGS